jgi:DNA-binding PadR family transcriptional regulator
VSRVTSRPEFSAQTLSVLAALCDQPSQWQHGYALAKQTGLKSGTLYPILIRLADRGLVEACWQDEPAPGRPRRHLYRLTAAGLASATGALASAAERAAQHAAEQAAARTGTGKPRAGVRPGPAARGAVAGMTS